MRLSPQARAIIRNNTAALFGPEARVKLFGARTDDRLRGGDIDLLVELPCPQPDAHRKSLTLVAHPRMLLGDQPIDILVIAPETPLQLIHRQATATGIAR